MVSKIEKFLIKGIDDILEKDESNKNFFQVIKSIKKEGWVIVFITSILGGLVSLAMSYMIWSVINAIKFSF